VNQTGGIHTFLGHTDRLTNFHRITVSLVVYVSLFGPRNPLTGNGQITIKPGCVGSCFGPRSPLNGFSEIAVKPERYLVVLL